MKSIFLILAAAFLSIGCRNPYLDFYKEVRPQGEVRDPAIFLPAEGLTIREGSNPEEESRKMLEEGFLPIGYSSFNGGEASEMMLREQAVKVGASHVIVYRKQTASMQGSANYFMPSLGMSLSVPQEHRRFDHLAQYFGLQNPKRVRLGIFYADLTPEMKTKIQSNKGVFITAVIKGSPAYRVDLLRWDIIRTVNDIPVDDKNHFSSLLTQSSGQMVTLGLVRGEETKRIDVQLNPGL